MDRDCGTCGYRINLEVAKERGLASSELSDYIVNMEYCYYYNDTVRRSEHLDCPNWVSYEEMDYEKNPPY